MSACNKGLENFLSHIGELLRDGKIPPQVTELTVYEKLGEYTMLFAVKIDHAANVVVSADTEEILRKQLDELNTGLREAVEAATISADIPSHPGWTEEFVREFTAFVESQKMAAQTKPLQEADTPQGYDLYKYAGESKERYAARMAKPAEQPRRGPEFL